MSELIEPVEYLPPSVDRRPVRERVREDAEAKYELLISSIMDALEAETTRWGSCGNCGHRVGVHFPDLAARMKAAEFMVNQGYGRPPEQLRVSYGDGDDFTADEKAVMKAALARALKRANDSGLASGGDDRAR